MLFLSVMLAILMALTLKTLAPVFYIITFFRVYKAIEWVNSDDSRIGSMTGKQVVSEIFVPVKLALENV